MKEGEKGKEMGEVCTSSSEALAVRNINVERKSMFAGNASPSANENHSNARWSILRLNSPKAFQERVM